MLHLIYFVIFFTTLKLLTGDFSFPKLLMSLKLKSKYSIINKYILGLFCKCIHNYLHK